MDKMLYIFCGLPFSGKTTLAKQLATKLNCQRIDLDSINSERKLGLNAEPISPKDWSQTYSISYQKTTEALNRDGRIIYDAANFTKAQRDVLKLLAFNNQAKAAIVYVALSEKDSRLRLEKNRQTGKRYDVRDEDFNTIAKNFEPPINETNVIVYQGESFEKWFEKYFS